MQYTKDRSDIEFMWYDSMTEAGTISWQNALTPANDSFLQDGGRRTADSMFLNFNWSAGGLDSSRTLARGLGRGEYELYSGIDTESDGYQTWVDWNALFPPGRPHTTSLGIYRPEWTWKSATDRKDYMGREARYWVGANNDPSDTTTSSSWKGLATHIAESTPVTTKPFVTNFSAGEGDFYNAAGRRVATGGWNNLSLQDVPPTYRWLVDSDGSRLTPSIDFDDAYEGASSLRLSGRLDAPNTIRLYQTRLPVGADTRLSTVLKGPLPGTAEPKIALSFTDAPADFTTVDLGVGISTDWQRYTLDLSAYAGRTIAQIALRVEGTAPAYDVRVGQLAVFDGTVDTPSTPTGLTVLGASDVVPGRSQSLRLGWTAPETGSVHHYEVYRRNGDGTRSFLGATPSDAYFVSRLDRDGTETRTTVEVEAVSTEYGRSPVASTTVPWTTTPQDEGNLALNRPATASGQCNAEETAAKAVNGSTGGGYSDKWCTLTRDKWLTVDLGGVRALSRFVVKHASAGGESASYNTRDFSIQVRGDDGAPWTTVATVTGNTAGTTVHPVTTSARHVRLICDRPTQTADPAARIYELEAWGPDRRPHRGGVLPARPARRHPRPGDPGQAGLRRHERPSCRWGASSGSPW